MIDILTDLLREPLQKTIHRCVKFDVCCAVGLFQTVRPHDIEIIKEHIRTTDSVISVDTLTSAVFYDYTDIGKARFAFFNLINRFDFPSDRPVVGFTQVYDTDMSADSVIGRLHGVLSDAKKQNLVLLDDHGFMENHYTEVVDFASLMKE